MEKASRLYVLDYKEARTYLYAGLFVIGNILFPQLCHIAVNNGGQIFLPIYFFTLIAAYRYGITVGILTAVCSPLVNHLMFGMPPAPMLMPILAKSVLLALAASWIPAKKRTASLISVVWIVLMYQIAGGIFEWLWTSSLTAALQDIRIGFPGILIQIFGGYALLKLIEKKMQ